MSYCCQKKKETQKTSYRTVAHLFGPQRNSYFWKHRSSACLDISRLMQTDRSDTKAYERNLLKSSYSIHLQKNGQRWPL